MKILKEMLNQWSLTPLIFFILASCNNHYVNIENIESAMNAQIGKPFTKTNIDNLINESEAYFEYQNVLNNGCSWAFKVNKKTNIVESWRITSERVLCEKGTNLY